MKNVDVKITTIDLKKLTGKVSDDGKFADTCDLIESCLDNIPQGGFTPKDIRERNRIQIVLDEYREERKELKVKADKKEGTKSQPIKLEDQDYDALKIIVNASRWSAREKVLQEFLDVFNS